MKAKIVLRPVQDPHEGLTVVIYLAQFNDKPQGEKQYVCCYMKEHDKFFVEKNKEEMYQAFAEVEGVLGSTDWYPVIRLEDVKYILDNDLVMKEVYGFVIEGINESHSYFEVDKKAQNIVKLLEKPDLTARMYNILSQFVENEDLPVSDGERALMIIDAKEIMKEFESIKK